MFDSNTVWVESVPFLGDYKPVNLSPSQFIVWNGNRCRHFNKTNITGRTRVSLDLRILPKICYDSNYSELAATTKQRFVIGEYYSEIQEI